jgi:hypothetical protein
MPDLSWIVLDWTRKLDWYAELAPHVMDAPVGFGKTSAAAVADLVRQAPAARGLPVKMVPKGVKETIYQPAPHFGRR